MDLGESYELLVHVFRALYFWCTITPGFGECIHNKNLIVIAQKII